MEIYIINPFICVILSFSTIALFLGSIYSGIFYRLGGMGGKWYKRSWIRDTMCTLTTIAVMEWIGKYHWSLYLCIPLIYGAFSTYWKILNKMLKYPTTDCYWFNWFFHGLGIGLALLPYAYFTHSFDVVLLRSYALAFTMMFWSLIIETDFFEETGRGVTNIVTLIIL